MLFDPKIKHNGKIHELNFSNPNKIILNGYSERNKQYKYGDYLGITDTDSVVDAISKLDNRIPTLNNFESRFDLDLDAMKKLYPNCVGKLDGSINLQDGMKLIFKNTLRNNGEDLGIYGLNIAYMINFDDFTESSDWKEAYRIIYIPPMTFTGQVRYFVVNEYVPYYVGDYEKSEFIHNYLIIEPYKLGTNYIKIYKSNLKSFLLSANRRSRI